MNYLLIIGTFESIFLIFMLLAKKNKSRSDLFLGLILFLYALALFSTFIESYNISHNFPYPFLINLNWLPLFLHGPALWFYIKSLSFPVSKFKPLHLVHFVPFIVFTIIHYFNFMQLPAIDKIQLVENDLFKEGVFYKISVLSIAISTITYNLWALKLIQKHKYNLVQNFSKIEDIDLHWLKILTIASLICYGVNVALFNLDLIFHFASYHLLLIITNSFAAVYVLVIGYFGLLQQNVFVNSKAADNETIKHIIDGEKKVNPSNAASNQFIDKLIVYMEQKQPYLEPEITISKLSKMLGVQSEFLSEMLNSSLKKSFFDFVNKYRIEEFKVQCLSKNNSHLTIIGIAYNCGFNSKAAFYRAFKKFEGISPGEYIQGFSQKSGTLLTAK
ncbi:MAG: AraC family transcriptional regulator [Bacteroidales bacterium]|nr:AraC family transcriptional regulator [Bacteroidales bacterium]